MCDRGRGVKGGKGDGGIKKDRGGVHDFFFVIIIDVLNSRGFLYLFFEFDLLKILIENC